MDSASSFLCQIDALFLIRKSDIVILIIFVDALLSSSRAAFARQVSQTPYLNGTVPMLETFFFLENTRVWEAGVRKHIRST